MTRSITAGRRAASAAALAVGVLMLGAGPTMAAAPATTPPITFSFYMYDPCFGGRAAANQTVHINWRADSGAAKAAGDVATNSVGRWEFCSSDASVWVAPGDRIKATVGSYTRNYVVPNLTAHVDRYLDKATGTGPAGRSIRVCSTWARFGDYEKCHGVRVAQDGTWSYNPGRDVGTDIWVRVHWTSPNNDLVDVFAVSGQVIVTIGKSKFSGWSDPRTDVVVNRNSNASGEATGDQYGEFKGSFRNASNRLAKVKVGDHITAPDVSPDVDFIVPQIDGSVDKAADVVSGRCYDAGTSSHFVWVNVIRSGGHVRARSFGDTDPNGYFSLDFHHLPPFGGTANIKTGDRVFIGCEQMGGDIAQLKLVVH